MFSMSSLKSSPGKTYINSLEKLDTSLFSFLGHGMYLYTMLIGFFFGQDSTQDI